MRWLLVPVVLGLWCGASSSARGGTLSFSPNPKDFGSVTVSADASSSTVTITNTGSNTAVATFAMGSGCAEFTAGAAGLPKVLNATSPTLVVTVTYDPADPGADECIVTTMDSNANVDQFTLMGTGTATAIPGPPGWVVALVLLVAMLAPRPKLPATAPRYSRRAVSGRSPPA